MSPNKKSKIVRIRGIGGINNSAYCKDQEIAIQMGEKLKENS
jgi:hypothetical protein